MTQISPDSTRVLGLLLDETDIAAAFDPGHSNSREIFRLGFQPQVFFEIVFGDVVASHHTLDRLSTFDNDLGTSLDQRAEAMRVARDPAEKAMQENKNKAAAERGEECRATVDCARQNRREN